MITLEEILNDIESNDIIENCTVFYNAVLVHVIEKFDISIKHGIISNNQILHFDRLSIDNDNINGFGIDITSDNNDELYEYLKTIDTTSLVKLEDCIHVAYDRYEIMKRNRKLSKRIID